MTDQHTTPEPAVPRRPSDVVAGTPLTSLAQQRAAAGARLRTEHDRGQDAVVGDALAQLAVGEAIRRTVRSERGDMIAQALRLGATWEQVAAALDTTELAAVDDLRVWAEGQRALYRQHVAEGADVLVGLDEDAYGEVMRWVAFGLGRAAVEARAEQTARLRAAVAATPMVDTVGELRALLEQLPGEMPLSLDDYHRALPGEPDQVHTIHPRLVATVSGLATEAETIQPGLMLTQVYVPFPAEYEEQAAVATRDDLPAYDELPRAADHLERGELRAGLKDIAEVLEELAHLLGEVAADVTEHDEDGSQLRVEAQRITHAAERVGRLAETVEEAAE
ncbi:hypothetical protein [Streptomyces rubradiris]|uniref:Uncharacterized protein n=1 Tax=Streptomyces rubradiris TaxID=285531 RepID=A0ABQ3RAA2_STRRR|nr:hypothetical protein [Streptomyces rubradiris]GHH25962.1 hypothetical protein GCM10018792_65790 [Streptomyces rubradiris]GHI52784.1 hypothetical protein Srubr_26300 [Streptomyces rubradiris]